MCQLPGWADLLPEPASDAGRNPYPVIRRNEAVALADAEPFHLADGRSIAFRMHVTTLAVTPPLGNVSRTLVSAYALSGT